MIRKNFKNIKKSTKRELSIKQKLKENPFSKLKHKKKKTKYLNLEGKKRGKKRKKKKMKKIKGKIKQAPNTIIDLSAHTSSEEEHRIMA